MQQRLEGPADTGCAGVSHEQFVSIDGVQAEECADDDEDAAPDLHAALPDEEFPEVALPVMHFCADNASSGDMHADQPTCKRTLMRIGQRGIAFARCNTPHVVCCRGTFQPES